MTRSVHATLADHRIATDADGVIALPKTSTKQGVVIAAAHTAPARGQGEQRFLEQDVVGNKIRTMLLAGIRCLVLWEQLGGGRFELLLRRRAYQKAAEGLLRNG